MQLLKLGLAGRGMIRKNNLRILMVTDAYYPYPSGVSEYVHYLSNALRDLGHKVHIVATSFGKKEDGKYDAIRIGKVFYVPLNGSYATMPVGFDVPAKMKYLMQSSRYDVIHLNGPIFPNLSFFALKYSDARVISTFLTSSEKAKGFGGSLFRKIFGDINAKIDVRIAISKQAQRTNEMYIPGKYHIVPLGIDVRRFTPRGDKYAEIGRNSILFVGRMDSRKGLHRLLRAFAVVMREVPDARLFVVGSGAARAKYERMADDYGIKDGVIFRGPASISELPEYFRSATVYTSPAEGGESFGLVLIEAMASGTPVVASCISGYDEVIENGRNGMLVDTADPLAYAECLLKVLQGAKLRRGLISEGLKDVRTKYNWDIVGRRIEQFYYS
jgi:phosphatidylinositol alpha-mannosyltransferase